MNLNDKINIKSRISSKKIHSTIHHSTVTTLVFKLEVVGSLCSSLKIEQVNKIVKNNKVKHFNSSHYNSQS